LIFPTQLAIWFIQVLTNVLQEDQMTYKTCIFEVTVLIW
jgi:hypothetical protein